MSGKCDITLIGHVINTFFQSYSISRVLKQCLQRLKKTTADNKSQSTTKTTCEKDINTEICGKFQPEQVHPDYKSAGQTMLLSDINN